jgi:pimeloyl-ACP methyl ester carboxylesterase
VTWPFALARAGFESFAVARQSIMTGSASRFGDGKPIILVPRFLGSDFALLPLSLWLKALGYRPVTVGLFLNLADSHSERSLSRTIRETTRRAGRKAVLMTHSSGMSGALRTADSHREWISDVVIYEAPHRPDTPGVRTRCIGVVGISRHDRIATTSAKHRYRID